MHLTNIIKRPLLTEKTYIGHAKGVYTFIVARSANKVQIKKVFEEIFKVKVDSVRTMTAKAKEKRVGKYVGKTTNEKKAIITLKPGEQLDIMNDL